MNKRGLFCSNTLVTVVSSIAIVMCFFSPSLFIEYELLRIVILIGGGFLPLLHLMSTIRRSKNNAQIGGS